MTSSATRRPATPGQTVGPFFGHALPFPGGDRLVEPGTPGAVRLHGRVIDGAGAGVPDALVELWQADAEGRVVQRPGSLRRDGWTFTGYGRSATDRTGRYSFTTLVPGPVQGSTPFFALCVFARGLLDRQFTRAYLPGDGLAADPFWSSLDAGRRDSLVARPDEAGFVFDVRLQGDDETVFVTFPGHRAG